LKTNQQHIEISDVGARDKDFGHTTPS